MDFNNLLGFTAGTLTTGALLPQFIKSLKSRSTKDISSWMLAAFCLGIMLWLIYGILIHSLPIILFNALSFVLGLGMVTLKIIYK
jgi:MtN3 and saliva related transmembrane protein